MFLNVDDLPPVCPAIGEIFLRIRFLNQYVDEPTLPNHKRKEDGLNSSIAERSFADGMMWLVLDEYKSFLASGKAFKAIPEVKTRDRFFWHIGYTDCWPEHNRLHRLLAGA